MSKRNIIIAAVVLGILGIVFCSLSGHSSFPREMIVFSHLSMKQETAVSLPRGTNYHLLLAFPGRVSAAQRCKGRAIISQNVKDIAAIEFDAASLSESNWLDRHNLSSLIVTSRKGGLRPLDLGGENGGNYRLRLVFDVPPPVNSSLWIAYLSK